MIEKRAWGMLAKPGKLSKVKLCTKELIQMDTHEG